MSVEFVLCEMPEGAPQQEYYIHQRNGNIGDLYYDEKTNAYEVYLDGAGFLTQLEMETILAKVQQLNAALRGTP